LQRGGTFEDLLRLIVDRGVLLDGIGREEEFFLERMAQHQNPGNPIICRLDSGKTFLLKETRTPDGGIVLSFIDISEFMKTEAALADNRERSRLILNSTGEGIYGVDLDGNCVFCNTACLRLLGYSFENHLLGRNMHALMHHTKEDGTPIFMNESGVYRAYKEGAGIHSDKEVLWREDGSSFPSEYRAFPIRSNDSILGAVVSFTDISERKDAEAALRESEERFRLAFEESTIPMGLTDAETGRLCHVNAAYCQWLGYTQEEMLEMTFLDITHPDDRGASTEHRNRLVEAGTGGFRLEKRYVHKDGTIFWAELNLSLLRDGDGNVAYTHGQIRDTTEQKCAMESYSHLALAIEELSDLVVLYDADDKLVACNRKFRDFFPQISHLAAPGTLFEDRQRAIVEKGLVEGIEGQEEEWLQERIRLHKTGEGTFETLRNGRWFLVREQRLPDGGTLTLSTDITEKKWADEERIVLESQLRQAQKLQTIGTLANGIAHDFNNILSPIMGYVDMALQDFPEDWQIHKNLGQVRKAAERAKDLVYQILTAASQGELEKQPVSVTDIVKETLSLLRPSLSPMIEIVENLDKNCPPVLADPTQVHQIVMNLCTNAYQAMGEIGGNLIIRTEVVSGEDVIPGRTIPEDWKYVRLSISDTGAGMDAKQVKRIFEPFYTTKEVGEGTGLGLSVVHGIINSHGGAITVNSSPGVGSTFYVYLPVMKSSVLAKDGNSPELSSTQGNEHVLYVDDDEEIAEMGQQMLVRMGYHVTVASNALEALEIIKADPNSFDLVITDHAMPKMTGTELTKELLKIYPCLPIILMTGSGEVINQARKNNIGISAYLMKPIVMHELSSVIKIAMERKKAA